MTMKKIFSILCLVLILTCCNFALTSCGDDDDDDDKVIKNLVGTWKDTTYDENYEYGFTFNADGTYSYYAKFKTNINIYLTTDKEGYLLKHKGTYIVSEDKLKLTLKQEYGCYPTARNNPDAEWEEDVHTRTSAIEWLENSNVILHPTDEMPPFKLLKVK